MTKKKTNEEFVSEIKSLNPFIIPLTPYTSSHCKMLFRCVKCGREWESYPYQQLNRTGAGCGVCSHKTIGDRKRKSNDVFTEELSKKNPNITLLSPYISNKQKVRCHCNLCGNDWEAIPDALLRGIGCPNCSRSATSFIEQFIYFSLCNVLGGNKVFSRDRKAIGKELDIYVPSLNLAIEYGSWYWHRRRISKDFDKQKLCREHEIRLILLYDSCNEEIIESHEDCYTYKQDLSLEKTHITIKRFVVSLCESYDIDCSVLRNNWDSIENYAYQKARKLTTADFIEQLKAKNTHNIEVLGEYKSSYDPVHCRCLDCGFEWYPRANNLLNENAGCPRCAGVFHYTNEDFTERVAAINPSFELLEPYTRSIQSVLCRCKKCGYEWKASPINLLKKRAGCPKCIGKIRYTDESFKEKLKTINPSITPIEPYPKNNKTKMLCLCNNCGNRFSMRPNNLLSGQGCPNCAKLKRANKTAGRD